MTLIEQLAALKATREERQKRLNDIAQKAMDEGRSMNTAEAEEFDTAEGEIKSIDADIGRLSRLAEIQKATAAPVGSPSPTWRSGSPSGTTRCRSRSSAR